MNTTNSEIDNNLKSAENYYNSMLAKYFDKMASYLPDNIHFIGPLAEIHGKEAVVSAAKTLVEYCRISRSDLDFHRIIRSCLLMIWSYLCLLVRSGQQFSWNLQIGLSLKSSYFMTPAPLKKRKMKFSRNNSVIQ
jgi:hypothetical protein